MPLLEFDDLAIDEVRKAYRWYRRIDPALASEFQTDFDLAVMAIEANPRATAKHDLGTRIYKLKQFPYMIVFKILSTGELMAYAVAHVRRRPRYWRRRTR